RTMIVVSWYSGFANVSSIPVNAAPEAAFAIRSPGLAGPRFSAQQHSKENHQHHEESRSDDDPHRGMRKVRGNRTGRALRITFILNRAAKKSSSSCKTRRSLPGNQGRFLRWSPRIDGG